jgi:hypothetical protein
MPVMKKKTADFAVRSIFALLLLVSFTPGEGILSGGLYGETHETHPSEGRPESGRDEHGLRFSASYRIASASRAGKLKLSEGLHSGYSVDSDHSHSKNLNYSQNSIFPENPRLFAALTLRI